VTCPRGWIPPPPWLRTARLLEFVRRVDAARIPGGTLTSWYRDPARNRACGGVRNSGHLTGTAIDYEPMAVRRLLDPIALRRAGLAVLDEGDHLHVSL